MYVHVYNVQFTPVLNTFVERQQAGNVWSQFIIVFYRLIENTFNTSFVLPVSYYSLFSKKKKPFYTMGKQVEKKDLVRSSILYGHST